jgi:periplasmic protein TonB
MQVLFVEKDGSLTNIKIIKGIAKGVALDEETLRMICKMPKWTPGKTNGKVVRVRFNLPIKFIL